MEKMELDRLRKDRQEVSRLNPDRISGAVASNASRFGQLGGVVMGFLSATDSLLRDAPISGAVAGRPGFCHD